MIRIYQALDLPQAQLMLDLLAQHGINGVLQNVNAAAAMGEVPFTHAYPEIWLTRERDVVRAKQLIDDFEQPVSPEQWQCQSCDESSPVTFEFCWACRSPRN